MVSEGVLYRDGEQVNTGALARTEIETARAEGKVVWLELSNPADTEMSALQSEFDLHPLAVEDAQHAHQRPKIEEYGNCLFVVLRTVDFDAGGQQVETGETHLFLGDDYVILVRHGVSAATLAGVRERTEQHPELAGLGPGVVLYAVTDEVVDSYGALVEALEAAVEEVEVEVFSAGLQETTRRVYNLKRQVLELRRASAPLEEPLDQLQRGDFPLTDEATTHYFRDVYDHVRRANDRLDGFRELLTGILEANAALVSLRQNEIVRKISGWAAIIAVPTLITGIYGMNFDKMPELDWSFGYPFALLLMLAVSSAIYVLLRRVGWL
jgi:magnesium transporter